MSDWPPPDPTPPTPPTWPQPTPAWTPYPAQPTAATPTLPWWRTTPAIIVGALLCLFIGGIGGVILTFAGEEVFGGGIGDDVSSADVRTYGPGGDLDAFALGPGQCAARDVDDLTSLDEADIVDCTREHATEVFAHADAPNIGGIGSPVDREDLAGFGDHACYLAFESYVGTTYDDSDFDFLAVIPSEEAWDGGGRTIHCVLFPYDDDTTTGSARGTGR